MATHDRCPFCGAPAVDDPGVLQSGLIAAQWTCGTWRSIDGEMFRSDGCGAREVADAARMRGLDDEVGVVLTDTGE